MVYDEIPDKNNDVHSYVKLRILITILLSVIKHRIKRASIKNPGGQQESSQETLF